MNVVLEQERERSIVVSRRKLQARPLVKKRALSPRAHKTSPVLATGMSGDGTKKAWFGWPDNAVVEMMRQEFALATDANIQKQLGDTIQGTVIDQGFYGNYGTFFVPVGYRNNVKGMIPSPVQFFWNMEVQR